MLNRTLSSGDTFHVKGTFNFGLYPNFSTNVKVTIISHVIKFTRGLTFEGSGTNANNTKTNQIVWFNPQGWGVGVESLSNTLSPVVFPNQSKGIFQVSLPVVSANPVQLRVLTMDGREVKQLNIPAGVTETRVDGSDLACGTYIVETISEGNRNTSQVIITR